MLSVRSCSPQVMNSLVPVIRQVPSSSCSARVRTAPTSEPASGSVSSMVPFHSPVSRWGTKRCLLVRGAELRQALDHALGQHGVERQGHVGRRHHLLQGQADHPGQAAAAVLLGEGQRAPPRLDVAAVGLREALRRGDLGRDRVVGAADLVADGVGRHDHLVDEPAELLDQGRDHRPGRRGRTRRGRAGRAARRRRARRGRHRWGPGSRSCRGPRGASGRRGGGEGQMLRR